MKLILTKHPLHMSDQIVRACKVVRPDTSPVFVSLVPVEAALPNKCVLNARKQETLGRGRCVLGWKLLTWPKVLTQFIGHAVVNREGQLVCVTPDIDGTGQILFVPDDSIRFNSSDPTARMPTRYVSVDRDPSVAQFISVIEQQDAIRCRYPPTSGKIAVTTAEAHLLEHLRAEELELIRQIALQRLADDDPCVCDSARNFGQCCKKAMLAV